MRRVSTRALLLTGLLVALVLAGVLSFYASSDPDGLEHVAEQVGISSTEEDHAASGSPLADYGTKGVENERLSGGIAGVVGVLLVGGLGGGLAWVLRRRRTEAPGATEGTAPEAPSTEGTAPEAPATEATTPQPQPDRTSSVGR